MKETDTDGGAPEGAGPSEAPPATFEVGATAVVSVAGDTDAYVVHGAAGDPRALVYMPGRCGDARAFRSWTEAASKHGTLVVVQGDEPCEGGARRRWSKDLARIDRRITAALRAVSEARGEALDDRKVTLLGYSEGAARAAALGGRFPERYPRLVLIAAPVAPTAPGLRASRAVVVMAGARDRQKHLREAAEAMIAAGMPVAYRVLPGAAHGEYGPNASRVMDEALAWVLTKAP